MLKPRGFVPWGLPGPTRGRRDAAALASKTKGTARMGGRVGAHRIYAPPSYAALRAALGIETDLVANILIQHPTFFMYGRSD